MKKAKIIGALLAAVIASAPATGLTGNVLSFNNNAIVAEAASSTTIYVKTNKNIPISGTTSIIKNDTWELVADSNGDIYCRNLVVSCPPKHLKTIVNGDKVDFHSPYDIYSIYPNKGVYIKSTDNTMKYNIYLQTDGNLVAYLKDNTGLPLWHTNSYSNAPKTYKYKSETLKYYSEKTNVKGSGYSLKVYESKYTLNDNGDLIIRGHYEVKKGKNVIYREWCKVWDSRQDTIDRIV